MENKTPSYLITTFHVRQEPVKLKEAKLSFLDKTIINSARAVKAIYLQAENATKKNVIHDIHPHVKLISLIYLVIIISLVSHPAAQIMITAFVFLCYVIAGLKVYGVYRKIFFLAFIFGFVVVFPASLNVITPGKIILNLISFNRPYHFWIYNIPQNIGFTAAGFQVVSLVFLRVLNSVSIALLIVYTTSFPSFIKSFRIIGIPDTFLMIISLAYKFIFILSRTIEETYFALKSRLLCNTKSSNIRNLIGGRIFFIFKKSMLIYENTYYAMVSRGYQGKVILHSQKHFTGRDFVVLIIVVALGIGVILL
jgi:cobalt/nickel transport system permease protein